MSEVSEIIKKIEEFAPPETASDWDNSGWQINLGKSDCNKILTALTVTDEVITQAINNECDLIISHHPIIFEPLKTITPGVITEAILHGIQIYSAHTNLDKAKGGTTDILAQKAGFSGCEPVVDFIYGKKQDNPINVYDLGEQIKQRLHLECLKIINAADRIEIQSIAFCAGAGGSEISKINELGFDLYITGEVDFHEAFDAGDTVIFETGHFESEKYVGEIFRNILSGTAELIEANEKRPWIYG